VNSAVITGASRGIGRAAALALARRGLRVALLARGESALHAVCDEVRQLGVEALALACDVSREAAVAQASARVLEAWGAPTVLVNNAGMIRRGSVDAMSLLDFRAVLDVNLVGTFLVTRAFLPAMRKAGRGRIVQVASISSSLGTAGASAYCSAKWGVVGFSKSLAEELRGSGLQTMSILPGSVDTDMLKGSGFAPEMTPDDVARTIVFVALDAPAAMNGSSVEVFGP
jgi:3-oxoacyl-[acyl-carrier protein] reductase